MWLVFWLGVWERDRWCSKKPWWSALHLPSIECSNNSIGLENYKDETVPCKVGAMGEEGKWWTERYAFIVKDVLKSLCLYISNSMSLQKLVFDFPLE